MVLRQRLWMLGFMILVGVTLRSQSFSHTSFDGTKIAYTMVGEGRPVLLVHGFLNNRKSWERTALFKTLVEKGYKVIVPDLRGNGTSDKPKKERAYQGDAEVKDLKSLVAALGITKYIAVGYSRGSIVLAKLLTEDPGISKAVLGGMGIDFTDPNWNKRKAFADAFNGTVITETAAAVAYARSIKADFRSLHLQQKYQPATTKEALSHLDKTQVLVLAGAMDTENGSPKELQKAIPNAKLTLVPGDHNTTYKTTAFSEVVMDFITNR